MIDDTSRSPRQSAVRFLLGLMIQYYMSSKAGFIDESGSKEAALSEGWVVGDAGSGMVELGSGLGELEKRGRPKAGEGR